MRGKFLIIFLLGCVALAGIFTYLNAYFIPVYLKDFLTQQTRQFLGRNVTFRDIGYRPLKGIVLRDLIIFQKDDPRRPFFHAEEIYGSVLLPPLFKSKRVVIRSLTLVRPSLHLTRSETGEWNFSDLTTKQPRPKGPNPLPFYLAGFNIRNGNVRLDTTGPGGKTTDILRDINITSRLSIKDGISFEAGLELLPPDTAAAGSLQVKGSVGLPSKDLNIFFQASGIPAERYVNMFYENPGLVLQQAFVRQTRGQLKCTQKSLQVKGDLATATDVRLPSGQHVRGLFSIRDISFAQDPQTTTLTGQLEAEDTDINLTEGKRIRGRRLDCDAVLEYQDNIFLVKGRMEGLDLDAQWDNGHLLAGQMRLTDIVLQREGSDLSLNGSLMLTKADISSVPRLKLSGDISADNLAFASRENALDLKGLIKIENGNLDLPGDHHIKGSFILKDTHVVKNNGAWTTDSTIEAGPTTLAFKGMTILASPVLMTHASYDPAQTQPLAYSGSLIVDQAEIKGLPRVESASGISGRIDFTTGRFTTHSLDLSVLGIPMRLSGSVEDLKNPNADIKVTVPQADIAVLQAFFPPAFKKSGLTLAGQAGIRMNYKGPLSSPQQSEIKAYVSLQNAALTGLKVPAQWPDKITGISGLLTLTQDSLAWEDLKAGYLNDTYFLNGHLKNFSRPLVQTRISSSLFDLSADLELTDSLIMVSSLKGTYRRSVLAVRGEIEKEMDSAFLDLQGKVTLNFEDIPFLLPRPDEKVKELVPKGTADIDLHFKGRPTDIKNAMITASIETASLQISKYLLGNVYIDLQHGYKNLSELVARADFYGGDLSCTSSFDLKDPGIPFRLAAQLKNTDLVKMRKGLGLKGEDLAGMLDVNLDAHGSLKDAASIEGSGEAVIRDGLLWKLKILEGLWKLLFIPEFEGVAFTDASAAFVIRDRRIVTQDLLLEGLSADMAGQGWIDFDKKLEFIVSPTFKESEIITSKAIQKGLSSLLAKTRGYISIEITGTLDKPSYTVTTFPTKMIQKATGMFFEGVGDVLQDILP